MRNRIIVTNKDTGAKKELPLLYVSGGGFFFVPRVGETIVVDGLSYTVQSVNYEYNTAGPETPANDFYDGYHTPWVVVTAR